MTKKPKNLNKNSNRQFLLQQRDMIDAQLASVPELTKEDLEEYFETYKKSLHEHEFSKSTQNVYLRGARKLINKYSEYDMYVTKDNLIQFKEDLMEDYEKVSTINSYITSVNRFLFYCDIGEFKISKVKGQGDNTLPHRIYDHEYDRMVRKAKAIGRMDLHYLIKIMGETGIRVNELKAFTVDSIQQMYVSVDNKGKVRRVPIPGVLRRDLRKYVKEQNITDGQVINLVYHDIYNGLKMIAGLCKINIKKVHPHAFRHFFGFKFVERKGELKLAQLSDIMGHSSVETTRIYTRGTLDDYLKAMEEIK